MQWKCSVCNSQNPVGTGGICVRCRKFACNLHLQTVLVDEQGKKKELVCSSCVTSDDMVEKRLRGTLRKWFS
jgi:hypothetical protein